MEMKRKTIDEEIKRDFEYAMSHVARSWLEMCSEYQEQKQQFPVEWTRDECYWFALALIAVRQNQTLERERGTAYDAYLAARDAADGDFTNPNDNPYILSDEELARAESAARSR